MEPTTLQFLRPAGHLCAAIISVFFFHCGRTIVLVANNKLKDGPAAVPLKFILSFCT